MVMVSIAPNQFQIEGIVESKKNDAALAQFVVLLVRLEKVEQLQGPAGIHNTLSGEIDVCINKSVASGVEEGMYLVCKIRKAPGRFFALANSIETRAKK